MEKVKIFTTGSKFMWTSGIILLIMKLVMGVSEIWAPLSIIALIGFAWLLDLLTDIKNELKIQNDKLGRGM